MRNSDMLLQKERQESCSGLIQRILEVHSASTHHRNQSSEQQEKPGLQAPAKYNDVEGTSPPPNGNLIRFGKVLACLTTAAE